MSGWLPSFQTFAKGTLASAAALGTLTAGLLYYGQNYLIYPSAFPPGSRTEVMTPKAYGMPYEDLVLTTQDGIKIRAYLILQQRNLPESFARPARDYDAENDDEFARRRPTVIMLHGNGGNCGHRLPLARIFYLMVRCNVLMLSYRGYGLSEGSPSERGIRIDAQTALNHIITHPILQDTKVVIYGQSIGGAIGIDLASRNPSKVHALVLENTFLSIPRLIPSAMPLLAPFSFLCHQIWDSATAITYIPPSVPILMLSGKRDEIVPAAHMQELFEISCRTGRNKGVWREFEKGSHNDTCIQSGYWEAVEQFVSQL